MATTQDRLNGLIGELGIKAPVLVATTAAITLSGVQTIDGVAVVAEDRVLVKDQSDTTTNGIYYCQASTWVRAPDFDGVRDCAEGTLVIVARGTANAGTLYRLTTTSPVIGTSNLTFSLFPNSASAFIQTLLDDTTAAAARTTLGAAALAGLSTQDFAAKNITASGTLGVTGAITPAQLAGIIGTTTNNDANTGSVGEFVSSTVAQGSALSLVSFTDKTVTSISLTAGDWDISGEVMVLVASTTSVTQVQGSTSLTTNLIDESYKFAYYTAAFAAGATSSIGWPIPRRRVSIASTTTVYLVARAGFTVSTASAWGRIDARRVR